MTSDAQRIPAALEVTIAGLIGAAIPLMIPGRAALQAAAAIAIGLILVLSVERQHWFRGMAAAARTPMGMLILAVFVGLLPNILVSPDPLRSFEAWGRTLFYVAAGYGFFVFLTAHQRRLEVCLKALLLVLLIGLTLIVIGLSGFYQLITLLKLSSNALTEKSAVLSVKSFASVGICLIPVALLAGQTLRQRFQAGAHWWWLGAAAVPLSIAVVYLTTNRAALASLMALGMAVVLLWGFRGSHGRKLIALLGTLLLTAAALSFLYHLGATFGAESTGLPVWLIDTHRQQIWSFVLERFAERPWAGYGLNTIERVSGSEILVPGTTADILPSHPHNWVLEIASEAGLLGLLPLIACLGFGAVRAIRRFQAAAAGTAIALAALYAAFWTAGLFNVSIWSTWWLLTFLVLHAIIEAVRATSDGEPSPAD